MQQTLLIKSENKHKILEFNCGINLYMIYANGN